MIAVIDKVTESVVDLITEETDFWFQIPLDFLKNIKIKEGLRIQFSVKELPTEIYSEDDFAVGGYIKNPPKQPKQEF